MKSVLAALVLLFVVAQSAPAQEPPAAGRVAPRCMAGVISDIFIDNHSIFDTSDPELDRRFAWAYRVANSLHVRTRESVVERELLVRPGECYDPALLEESERLLRGYDFLSRIDIFAIPQPDSTYHVIVDTQDEWSTRVDLRVALEDGLAFEGGRLRESNILGTGRSVELFYLDRDANRDYGVAYQTPQLAGSRWDLHTAAGRTRAGTFFTQAIAYPFVGEAGRWAARQGFRRQDRFFDYIADEAGETHLLLPVRDKGFDLAVVRRAGRVGSLTTFGAALGFAELGYPGGAGAIELVRDDDFDDPGSPDSMLVKPVESKLEELSTFRLMFLIGQRNIRWVKRRGLDSMRGEQDIRLGAEVDLAFGPSLPGRDDDNAFFTTLGVYGGAEAGNLLAAGRLRADGRRDGAAVANASGWEDLFADGELLAYWKPGSRSRQTLVLRAGGTAGWHTRTPFQLTLGGDRGVRGYDRERFPGGRRVLFSLEDRVYLGWPFREILDLGGTIFLDAGRVWPGDVPFGVDSGWKGAAGVGLRGAFPAGGRTTYRVDVALPLERGAGWKELRLVVSIGELLGLASRGQALASRQVDALNQLFYFPE